MNQVDRDGPGARDQLYAFLRHYKAALTHPTSMACYSLYLSSWESGLLKPAVSRYLALGASSHNLHVDHPLLQEELHALHLRAEGRSLMGMWFGGALSNASYALRRLIQRLLLLHGWVTHPTLPWSKFRTELRPVALHKLLKVHAGHGGHLPSVPSLRCKTLFGKSLLNPSMVSRCESKWIRTQPVNAFLYQRLDRANPLESDARAVCEILHALPERAGEFLHPEAVARLETVAALQSARTQRAGALLTGENKRATPAHSIIPRVASDTSGLGEIHTLSGVLRDVDTSRYHHATLRPSNAFDGDYSFVSVTAKLEESRTALAASRAAGRPVPLWLLTDDFGINRLLANRVSREEMQEYSSRRFRLGIYIFGDPEDSFYQDTQGVSLFGSKEQPLRVVVCIDTQAHEVFYHEFCDCTRARESFARYVARSEYRLYKIRYFETAPPTNRCGPEGPLHGTCKSMDLMSQFAMCATKVMVDAFIANQKETREPGKDLWRPDFRMYPWRRRPGDRPAPEVKTRPPSASPLNIGFAVAGSQESDEGRAVSPPRPPANAHLGRSRTVAQRSSSARRSGSRGSSTGSRKGSSNRK